MTWRVCFCSVLMLACIGLAVATAMGSSAPIGSLVGSENASLDGQVPLSHIAVLSGDTLQVSNGLAMVVLNHGSRMILGRESEASFSGEGNGVTVSLTRGNMSFYHAAGGTVFRVKVGNVTVAPPVGSRATGEVAMVDGALLVTAKDGALQVEKDGTKEEVGKGEIISIATTADSAPVPVPSRGVHIKRILSHMGPVYMGVGAAVAGATIAAIELTRTSVTASPVTPAP